MLAHVVQAIDEDSRHCGHLETGSAPVRRVSYEARTIPIAGMVAAPPIRCGAIVIVTLNERDFPEDRLATFGIEVQIPTSS
ncbi:hypothetical protein [Pelomonas cellulosilytica]|uniref:Uncharacterized protein n=1 Tax=Pelomonas cellulosilytica TaxID=2906762 RepID=A0ABS8XP99_9BURK|nr:hypothetical protein [Pelomonas sp. P8]MCE4552963.1 hypothetical protein [Pelomonas sp. P8]